MWRPLFQDSTQKQRRKYMLIVLTYRQRHPQRSNSIFPAGFIPRQAPSHLLQVFVTVDKLSLVRVLEFMGLDVLPQSLDDDRSGLGVDAQHAGQSRVQLELRGLGFSEHSETVNDVRTQPLPLKSPPSLVWVVSTDRPTDLVVEHEQDGAADAHVARPLHLEAVGLLGGGGSVPLNRKH